MTTNSFASYLKYCIATIKPRLIVTIHHEEHEGHEVC